MRRFLKKLGDLMVSYPKSSMKHVFDIPCFTLNLYSNIVVPSWVLLNGPCPKIWVVEADFNILKKVSTISMSSPNSFCWNASRKIPSVAWVSCKKLSILSSTSLPPSPTWEELVLLGRFWIGDSRCSENWIGGWFNHSWYASSPSCTHLIIFSYFDSIVGCKGRW